jgi:hypothetical protein
VNPRRIDLLIIIAAALVPLLIEAAALSGGQWVRSQSARNAIELACFISVSLFWVAMLAWTIVRLVRRSSPHDRPGGSRLGALLIVILFSPWCIGGWIILIEADQWFKIIPEQRRLLHSTDHRAVADACALILKDVKRYQGKSWDDASFPAVIRDIRPSHVIIYDREIRIEMHGGFDHYGFDFRQASPPTWDLWYYTESGPSVKLIEGMVVD